MERIVTAIQVLSVILLLVGVLAMGIGVWALTIQLAIKYVGAISTSVLMIGLGLLLVVMSWLIIDSFKGAIDNARK